jgi:hypothetical protein
MLVFFMISNFLGDSVRRPSLLVDAGGYCEVGTDCFPSFGNRFYSGLRTVEPITSIIALQVLRFAMARKTIVCDNQYKWSDLDVAKEPQSEP